MSLAEGTSRARLERGSTERFVGLRKELGVKTFGLNQMNLQPGQQGRIHRHEHQEEVYIVLDGELTVTIEGEDTVLGPNEILRVAPDLRRRLSNRSHEPVTLIALGGSTEHEGRDGEAFPDWEATEGAPPQEVPLPEDLPLS